jgi:arsenite methyltransferase
MASVSDAWSEWILHRRHGGDSDYLGVLTAAFHRIRDRLLHNSRVEEGNTVLDIGTGDGLVALAALLRVGHRGQVIFSDTSAALLEHCAEITEQSGDSHRCRFVQAPADALTEIGDHSVDVVTVRSVLCHVADKGCAFQEFFRVLTPGGRLSIHEWIVQFGHPAPTNLFWGYDVTPVLDLATRVRAVYGRAQPVTSVPFGNFDERDLLTLAERAGFGEIHLEYEAEIKPTLARNWSGLLKAAPNPNVPTLAEAMQTALTPAETERFTGHLRPLVEEGRGLTRSASTYLWAIKS